MIRIININFYNTVLYWSLVFWIQDHLEQLLRRWVDHHQRSHEPLPWWHSQHETLCSGTWLRRICWRVPATQVCNGQENGYLFLATNGNIFSDLPECCGDELSSVRQLVNHVGHSFPIHRVQSLVNLVKQIKRSWVTFLQIRECWDWAGD